MSRWILLLLTLSTYVVTTFAVPTPGGGGVPHGHNCVSDTKAAELVQDIQSLYHCMDPVLAEQVLTPDYVSYSYTLLRSPGGTFQDGNNVYASSRDDFVHKGLAGNAATCNGPSFRTYKIWNGCDTVGFWWSLNSGPDAETPFELVGIDILEVDVASGKVKADYSEFSY